MRNFTYRKVCYNLGMEPHEKLENMAHFEKDKNYIALCDVLHLDDAKVYGPFDKQATGDAWAFLTERGLKLVTELGWSNGPLRASEWTGEDVLNGNAGGVIEPGDPILAPSEAPIPTDPFSW